MKHILSILFLLLSLNQYSQSNEYIGEYEFYRGNNDSFFFKTYLTLNADGTFFIFSESYVEERFLRERMEYGKGTWTSDKQLIFLKAKESDIDDKHVLNLNNTRLRYDTKSPRDKSNRDIKTSVRIIESENTVLKGRTLIKDVSTTPIIKNVECCKSTWQAHSYLNGKWKNNKDNKEYHYSFKDERGELNVYEKNEDGILKGSKNNPTPIKVFNDESKYKIIYGDERLKAISTIKYLDQTKLILVRRDGKESVLYRFK